MLPQAPVIQNKKAAPLTSKKHVNSGMHDQNIDINCCTQPMPAAGEQLLPRSDITHLHVDQDQLCYPQPSPTHKENMKTVHMHVLTIARTLCCRYLHRRNKLLLSSMIANSRMTDACLSCMKTLSMTSASHCRRCR